MKTHHRALLVLSLALLVLALVGAIFGRIWLNPPAAEPAKAVQNQADTLVDEQPLTTAQQLAALVVTQEEQGYGQNALRVADHEVDLAFASALRDASSHAAPLTPEARKILTHIEGLQAQVNMQQDEIARLKSALASASEKQKPSVNEELELQQALLEVSQEELDESQQELIQAGGDPRTTIQQLQDQHEAAHQQIGNGEMPGHASQDSPEATTSHNVVAEFRAWRSLRAKEEALAGARKELAVRRAALLALHEELEKEANGNSPQQPANAQQSAPGQARSQQSAAQQTAPPQPSSAAAEGSGHAAIVSSLKHVAEAQMDLAALHKRALDFKQLDGLYGKWAAEVKGRERIFLIGLVESALWICGMFLLVALTDPILQSIFAKLDPEGRRLHTVRVALLFALQFAGAALILLLIFGPPSQLATVIALAGAGLTVALKDFIVGFFGWFALMGPNGIRPGDWVEINGIGGEVLEVGPLHTILLETGSWSKAGHPTGRKVSIVNSYAIEGHYFNFSTNGQWLWDEIQLPIPSTVDPHPLIAAIQKTVATETQANTKLAEEEWKQTVVANGKRHFSAGPAISVQPSSGGVNLLVRYITRRPEWHEVRARLNREMIEILRAQQVPHTPPEGAPSAALRSAASVSTA
jgi:small-conductance mechanosensitive channel